MTRHRPDTPDTATAEPHRARKRFGQHFLHDRGVIDRLVRVIAPERSDHMVEIGPGLGALTVPLLQHVAELDAVELDRDVIPHLLEAAGDAASRLRIHRADALRFDFAALANDGRPLRLVGNLPYNISTPLLFHLLAFAPRIRDMHFMLQKEVVDRMTAAPDSADYGRLTVTLAARADAVSLFDIGPGAFKPPPKVMSSIVRLRPRVPDFAPRDLAVYDRIVTAAFSQRRKTLSNTLKGLIDGESIAASGINPGARAETLSPAQFAMLADTWSHVHKNSA